MKDSLINSTSTIGLPTQVLDSIQSDLSGIRYEIVEYNKLQTQEKPSVSNDTVFTVIVTLSIFILGIVVDRILKYCDRKKKERQLKSFFFYHLNRANEHFIPALKDVYLTYSQEKNIDTGITSTPPKVLSSDFQRLLNTNFEELFKAYENKDVFSKTISQIEFIDKVQIEVNGFHDRVYMDSGEVRDELEILIDEYLSLLSQYAKSEKKSNTQYEKSETFKLIYNSIKVYYTEIAGTRKLSVLYSDIIRAIQEHIVKTGEYETNSILSQVAEKGRKISHVVSKLKQKTGEITEQYEVYSDYMSKTNKALTELIPKLK